MPGRADWADADLGLGPGGGWAEFERAVLAAAEEVAGADPDPAPPLVGSDWYGSSDNFSEEIRLHWAGLAVPEHAIVPLAGGPAGLAWDPGRERPPASGPCPSCLGRIRPGSALYCPACHASGYDGRLARQRRMAGTPPPEPPAARVPPPDWVARWPPPRPRPAPAPTAQTCPKPSPKPNP